MTTSIKIEYAAIDKMIRRIKTSAESAQTIKDQLTAIKRAIDPKIEGAKTALGYVTALTTEVDEIIAMSLSMRKTLANVSQQTENADKKSAQRFAN